MTMAQLLMTIECTLSAIRLDGHGGPPVQYIKHHPMQHVQGYSGSHWMLPSGNYSLRIAPGATRATGKQTTINKYTKKMAILMAAAMRLYNTTRIAQWRRSRALLEAVKCCHWASIATNSIKGTWHCKFFWCFSLSKP
jgi:hypothetical protein